MPENFKTAQVLGTTSLDTYSTLYSTSSSTQAVISTIAVCNTASVNNQFRIGITSSATTPSPQQWIAYNTSVAAQDTSFITVGLTLENSKFIRVSSNSSSVAFSAYIAEIT